MRVLRKSRVALSGRSCLMLSVFEVGQDRLLLVVLFLMNRVDFGRRAWYRLLRRRLSSIRLRCSWPTSRGVGLSRRLRILVAMFIILSRLC